MHAIFTRRDQQWWIQDFPEAEAPTIKLVLFYKFFAENCIKMKEFGPRGAGRPWCLRCHAVPFRPGFPRLSLDTSRCHVDLRDQLLDCVSWGAVSVISDDELIIRENNVPKDDDKQEYYCYL